MAGLNLGFNAGLFVPAPALPPSYAAQPAGATISSRAYGVADASAMSGRNTAGLGSAAVGTAAAVLLTWVWWTLPR